MEQFICYAVGQGNDWKAVCVDLDIAVNGRSLQEACEGLAAAIDEHIDGGLAESGEGSRTLPDCSLNVLDFAVRPI